MTTRVARARSWPPRAPGPARRPAAREARPRRPRPPEAPPARLSETGLYADAASLVIDARNRPFTPQYPLWSDGAEKRRWVRLPDGAAIDARALDHWDFPIGTRFWKEFAFDGRRVETRMFWKTAADHWEFASYVWDDDQRDADAGAGRGHRRRGRSDARQVAQHPVARGMPRLPRLGPHRGARLHRAAALRRPRSAGAARRAADAGHGDAAHARRRRSGAPAPPGLAASPPRVAAATPTERAVLGYLSTNCGSCHNRQSTIASLGLFLKYTLDARGQCGADALATTLDQVGHWLVPRRPRAPHAWWRRASRPEARCCGGRPRGGRRARCRRLARSWPTARPWRS